MSARNQLRLIMVLVFALAIPGCCCFFHPCEHQNQDQSNQPTLITTNAIFDWLGRLPMGIDAAGDPVKVEPAFNDSLLWRRTNHMAGNADQVGSQYTFTWIAGGKLLCAIPIWPWHVWNGVDGAIIIDPHTGEPKYCLPGTFFAFDPQNRFVASVASIPTTNGGCLCFLFDALTERIFQLGQIGQAYSFVDPPVKFLSGETLLLKDDYATTLISASSGEKLFKFDLTGGHFPLPIDDVSTNLSQAFNSGFGEIHWWSLVNPSVSSGVYYGQNGIQFQLLPGGRRIITVEQIFPGMERFRLTETDWESDHWQTINNQMALTDGDMHEDWRIDQVKQTALKEDGSAIVQIRAGSFSAPRLELVECSVATNGVITTLDYGQFHDLLWADQNNILTKSPPTYFKSGSSAFILTDAHRYPIPVDLEYPTLSPMENLLAYSARSNRTVCVNVLQTSTMRNVGAFVIPSINLSSHPVFGADEQEIFVKDNWSLYLLKILDKQLLSFRFPNVSYISSGNIVTAIRLPSGTLRTFWDTGSVFDCP